MYEQKSIGESCELTKTTTATGLTSAQAVERLQQNGKNELEEKKKRSKISAFLAQLKDPTIFILLVAAAIYIGLGDITDSFIILIVVLLNAVIGLVQEFKAEAALEALKQMSSPYALVRRDGNLVEVPAKDLVVGDVVILEAGRVIPADLRLTTTVNLKVEESALTGESTAVDKDAEFIADGDISLGDRINMAFSSTSVAYGRGEGVVVATGMDTEIGKIAKILDSTEDEMTPLQIRLADLGKMLGIAAVAICAAMAVIAIVQGRDMVEMLLTAISLAVAAVPEGLPAVVTIVLAMGVQRMVKVNTIVRRLPSVETLGAVSVVCSDKTGTLTQNKMTVLRVYRDEQLNDVESLDYSRDKVFIDGFVLCNDASTAGGSRTGDPTELALIDMGTPLGLTREGLEVGQPRINEQAFDSDRKLMTTVHKVDGKIIAYTKGAVDNIIERCDNILINGETRPLNDTDKENINKAAYTMATEALRVLCLALKLDDDSADEHHLTFVGLVGMIDPPRPEARDSVEQLRGAGVRTVMITGDHRDTALAIAKSLTIAESESQCLTGEELSKMTQEDLNACVDNIRVFARVSPEHKVMIVKALKSLGYIVSMTGDGVNDAPSLKAADIGVAMGVTGTDVAKGAADMVLTDDNFSTIGKAVEEGRHIYANIKKTVIFLLSSNIGEVISMFTAIVLGIAAPLKAVQILWVNLVTDTLPGLALGMDSGNPEVMKQKPRHPSESLFAHGGMFMTLLYGLIVGCITLAAFLFQPIREVGWNLSAIDAYLNEADHLQAAQTFAFVTLCMSQLFHAWGMRNTDRSIFRNNPFGNKMMCIAFVVGVLLQVCVTEIPVLTEMFGTIQLSLVQWCELLLFAIVPLIVHEIIVFIKWIASKVK